MQCRAQQSWETLEFIPTDKSLLCICIFVFRLSRNNKWKRARDTNSHNITNTKHTDWIQIATSTRTIASMQWTFSGCKVQTIRKKKQQQNNRKKFCQQNEKSRKKKEKRNREN